jgi:predicted kinase
MTEGKPVVWDAVFAHERKRREVTELAGCHGYECVFVCIVCDDDAVVSQRLSDRKNDASDGDFNVYLQLKSVFELPKPYEKSIMVGNSGNLETLFAELRKSLPSAQ